MRRSQLDVRAIISDGHQAISSSTAVVDAEISVGGAAHHAGDADGHAVAVGDEGVVGGDRAPTSSRVTRRRRRACRTRSARPGDQVEVVGVVGVPELEHHVVGDVHHAVDGAYAEGGEAVGQPLREVPTVMS